MVSCLSVFPKLETGNHSPVPPAHISSHQSHSASGGRRPIMDWAGLGHLNLSPANLRLSAHQAPSEHDRGKSLVVIAECQRFDTTKGPWQTDTLNLVPRHFGKLKY